MRLPFLAASALFALFWLWRATGLDRVKYRGWRERLAKWRESRQTPPLEYRIDNRRWRFRLIAVAVGLLSLSAATLTLLLFEPPTSLLWLLYGMSCLGIATWAVMGEYVR